MARHKVLLAGTGNSGSESIWMLLFPVLTAPPWLARGRKGGALCCGMTFDTLRNCPVSPFAPRALADVRAVILVLPVDEAPPPWGGKARWQQMATYRHFLDLLAEEPDIDLICFIHKMDLLPSSQRYQVYSRVEQEVVHSSLPRRVACLPTSIWDESLFLAFSVVQRSLIPAIERIDARLKALRRMCGAQEIQLLDRNSLVTIAFDGPPLLPPSARTRQLERIKNMLVPLLLNARRDAQMESFEWTTSKGLVIIQEFTPHTLILLFSTNTAISARVLSKNLGLAASHFDRYLPLQGFQEGKDGKG